MKKALSLVLVLLLLTGSTYALADVQAPFEEPFTFSYLTQIWEPYSTETNLISYWEDAMNVKMDIEWAPVDNYSTRVLTALAGEMPDAIMLRNVSDVATLIDQGALVPLTDLLDEYCPNLMQYITDEDLAYLYNVGDGEIYMLPAVTAIPNINTWTIRQDWLDNVGMEIPSDWEGWKSLLRAFRDQDANGNGDTTDEIPYAGELWPFLYSFGIYASNTNNGISGTSTDSLFCINEAGDYTLIFEHERYREYMTEMVEMYKEGLIDPEFATREETEKRKVMNSNQCGLAFTQAEQCQLSTDSLRAGGVSDATWVGIPPIAGPYGDQALFARSKFGFYTVITNEAAENDKVIGILKFFNWMFSEEGAMISNYGIEGMTYDMIDGKPVMYDDVRADFVSYRNRGMDFQPISHLWLVDAYVQVLTSGIDYEDLPETRKLFYDAFYLNDPYFVTSPPILQTEAYIENANTLLAEAAQLQAQCVAGLITIDEFYDKYDELKASGLQDVIDQGREAYAAMK